MKTEDVFIFAHLTMYKGCRMGAGWKKIVEQKSLRYVKRKLLDNHLLHVETLIIQRFS